MIGSRRISSEIRVGHIHKFECLREAGHHAVFRKIYQDGTDRVRYIVTPIPPDRYEPPASVLLEFMNELEAIKAFIRWQEDPLLARPVSRRKKRGPDSRQSELGLDFEPKS